MTTATKLMNKGRQENQKTTIIKLHENAGFTIDQIVKYLDIDRAFVEAT